MSDKTRPAWTKQKLCTLGGYPASHAGKSRSESQALRPVVLQKGTGIQQSPQEAHEAPATQNTGGQTERERRRALRPVLVLHKNPLLLLLGNPQDPRKHLRNVRLTRFRGPDSQPFGTDYRNRRGRRIGGVPVAVSGVVETAVHDEYGRPSAVSDRGAPGRRVPV